RSVHRAELSTCLSSHLLSFMIFHCFVYFFFFFSSRRRHTRLVSDWSSDVCSSDLRFPSVPRRAGSRSRQPATRHGETPVRRPGRSEERRVGKEWRSRWARDH